MTLELDHTIFHFINQDCANPVLDTLCPILRNKNTWLPFYIIGALWIFYRYRWQGLWMIAFAGLAILISDQSSNRIKHLVHRIRPCASGESVRLLMAHCSDTFSFTSNHAANHFALAVFLTLTFSQYKWLAPLLFIWASLIALSQVYVGLHYPADVIAGALLGSGCGWIAYRSLTRLAPSDYKSK